MSPDTSKEARIKVYAREHPEQSATAIYEHFKGTKYGTRKTDALRYVREERKAPAISENKKYSSTPVKYRKGPSPKFKQTLERLSHYRVLPALPPTKNLQKINSRLRAIPYSFAIAEVNAPRKKRYIKFTTVTAYNKELSRLAYEYGFDKNKTVVVFKGPYAYRNQVFVTEEFEQEAKRRGLW